MAVEVLLKDDITLENLIGKFLEIYSEKGDFKKIQKFVDEKGCMVRFKHFFSDKEIKFLMNEESIQIRKDLRETFLVFLKENGITFKTVGIICIDDKPEKKEYAFVIKK